MVIKLNLASEPLRNRRFYWLLSGLMVGASVIILLVSLGLLTHYRVQANRIQKELIRLARMEDSLRREEKQFSARASALSKEFEAFVEQANDIISQKSFPWSDFFSRLEKALPPACYLTSLAFTEKKAVGLQVRFKLASPDLPTLLATIEALKKAGFSGLRVENEDQAEGALISEVVMTYERTD